MGDVAPREAGPTVWVASVDPMLDELATSYAASRPAASIAPECLPAVAGAVASEEGAEVEMANNPPSDVQPTSTSPREMFLASPSSLAAEFAKQVLAPLKTPLIKEAPLHQNRRSPSSASIRRSIHLAAKCGSRAANATLQAQKVLTAKWDPNPQPQQNAPAQVWLLLNRLYRSHSTLQRGRLCAS